MNSHGTQQRAGAFRPTDTLASLMTKSPAIRREVEDGHLTTSTSYVPTDWDVEDDSILGGWNEALGTCPVCFLLRAANGSCACV